MFSSFIFGYIITKCDNEGKNYYIVQRESPYQGLTFEWYMANRYDYVLLANRNNNIKKHTI